jgi:hypothetical protein
MVGAARFELATSCAQGRRASQATLRPDSRYHPMFSVPRNEISNLLNLNRSINLRLGL